MARCPIFRGENYLDQIKKINEILGSPDENDMSYIADSNARKFITNLPKNKKIGFNQIFPKLDNNTFNSKFDKIRMLFPYATSEQNPKILIRITL